MAPVQSFDLRVAGPGDQELLWEVFRSSRAEALEALPEALIRMQHRAREASYAASYPGAVDLVITVSGRPAGRVLVWRSEREHRIVDIAILPTYRDHGLGTLVIRSLIDEAGRCEKALRLMVATDNTAAARLYRGLGFETKAEDAMNVEMEIAAPKTSARRAHSTT